MHRFLFISITLPRTTITLIAGLELIGIDRDLASFTGSIITCNRNISIIRFMFFQTAFMSH